MNSVLSSFLLTLAVAGIVLLIILIRGKMLERKRQNTRSRSESLPGPGHSLRSKVQRLNESVHTYTLALVVSVGLFVTGHLALTVFGKLPESWPRGMASLGGGTMFTGFLLWRWFGLAARRRLLRMGMEGEVAVGEALEQLSERGYRVYHDFPAERFNIDHIVIGPFGIMAVETRTRTGGRGRRDQGEAIVSYDGRMLHFPKNSDHQTIDKAKDQAVWLSEWLSESMEDAVSARALVAIPGWHVKRTSADGIPVVNPKQFPTLFDHISHRPLPEETAQCIIRKIERQYRDKQDAGTQPAS